MKTLRTFKTLRLLACGLLAGALGAPVAAFAAEAKPAAENPKVKAQEEAIAKVDEASIKEVEKVKAEVEKKLAEVNKKAAVARIAVRSKAIEELTREKKRAIAAEKLDEARLLKEKIDALQKEADALLAEGSDGVEGTKAKAEGVNLKDPKTVARLMVGRWNHTLNGKTIRVKTFFRDGHIEDVATDGSNGNWKPEQKPTWRVSENGEVAWSTKDDPAGSKIHFESENLILLGGGSKLERIK